MDSLLVKVVLQFLYTVLTLFRGGVHTSPTKDAHDTRRRRFNAEKQTFSVALNSHLDLAVLARISLFDARCL